MSYDENLPRWFEASILKWIDDNKPTNSFVFYEGQERKTSNYRAWFEVRIDGPLSRELTKDHWLHNLEVNVLCSVGIEKQFYNIVTMLGAMAKILDTPIPVFKYGNGPDDNSMTKLGCLTLDNTDKRGIIIHKYGQIEPKIKLIQATVEARYYLYLP